MEGSDTITAISTPPGEGGIGVIRVSGEEAISVGRKVLRHLSGKEIKTWPERQVRLGLAVLSSGAILDQVIFFIFRGPSSYTGEDILEIQAHGGNENLKLILSAVLEAGARLAEPGEFTKRAFFHGKLDLSQAEAVIDLIKARTELAHKAAVKQLTGGLSKCLDEIERDLMEVLVPIEAALDYPEEELPELNRMVASRQIRAVKERLEELIAQAKRGRILREAATVVLAGRPNVGKSSILNCLLGEERAIVTEVPGTTRDFVGEEINLGGFPVYLVDTAGLRESADPVERKGIARAWQWIEEAELVLFIIDGAMEMVEEEIEFLQRLKNSRIILVLNKTDLPQQTSAKDLAALFPGLSVLSISSLTGAGLDSLRDTILKELTGMEIGQEYPVLITRVRHQEALKKAVGYLECVVESIDKGFSEDLIAVDIRAALEAVGEITGRTVSEEIVNNIFSQFCIGK